MVCLQVAYALTVHLQSFLACAIVFKLPVLPLFNDKQPMKLEDSISSSPPLLRVYWFDLQAKIKTKISILPLLKTTMEKVVGLVPLQGLVVSPQRWSASDYRVTAVQDRSASHTKRRVFCSLNPRSFAAQRSHWMSSASPHTSGLYFPSARHPPPLFSAWECQLPLVEDVDDDIRISLFSVFVTLSHIHNTIKVAKHVHKEHLLILRESCPEGN